MTTNNTIQVRRATAAAFTLLNPVLADGEPGYETDTRKIKYGNGVTAWNSLAYAGGAVESVAGRSGNVVLTKSDVGLSNVTNTDATLRSNHTGTQLASTISDFNTAVSTAAPVQSVNSKTGAVTLTTNDMLASPYDSWTNRSLPTNSLWQSIAYGNGVFVAVAYGSSIAATSTDGITWTQRTLPVSSSWRGITYGNGLFVTVSYTSGTIAATSTDGITWTQRTLPATANWVTVGYGNGTFVALADNSTVAASSTNGITWTQRTLPTSSFWKGVSYGNGIFVVVSGLSGSIAASSTDGITWTQRTLPASANWWATAYGNGLFIAVSHSSNIAATSTNGTTWTQRTLPSGAGCMAITYGNGVFIATVNGSNVSYITTDGITWTTRNFSGTGNWQSGAYGDGVFVAGNYSSSTVATNIGKTTNIIDEIKNISPTKYGTSTGALVSGFGNTASGSYSHVCGGFGATSDRYGMGANASGFFASSGDAQSVKFVLRNKTTNATPTTLFLDGSSVRLTIPSGKALFAHIIIAGIRSDGGTAAHYHRKVGIKNVGGTTSLLDTQPNTIGTDFENTAGYDVTITADDTNDALQINVTGAASETIRWVAVVEGLEIAYGT